VLLKFFAHVGQLSADDEVTADGVQTALDDRPIATGSDVLHRIARAAVSAAAEADDGHCQHSHQFSSQLQVNISTFAIVHVTPASHKWKHSTM